MSLVLPLYALLSFTGRFVGECQKFATRLIYHTVNIVAGVQDMLP